MILAMMIIFKMIKTPIIINNNKELMNSKLHINNNKELMNSKLLILMNTVIMFRKVNNRIMIFRMIKKKEKIRINNNNLIY